MRLNNTSDKELPELDQLVLKAESPEDSVTEITFSNVMPPAQFVLKCKILG